MMSKKDRRTLESIAAQLEGGLRCLHSPRIVVCVKSHGTTTLDYKRDDGSAVYPIDKEMGTELCLLTTALHRLNEFAGFVQPQCLTN